MIKNTQTKKLALSYLAIIMTLSLLFSVLIYFIISSSLDKPLPIDPRPQDFSLDLKDHFQTRDVEVKNSILLFLGILNLIILFTGYWISQILARRTLAPIERSIRKQSQFISDASHELKTPLAAMLINNEVALRKNNLTIEKARETISKNITEIERLKNLINHMLLLARDDKKELESKINIQDLLESLVNNFRVIAKTKKHRTSHFKQCQSCNDSPKLCIPNHFNFYR